MLLIDLPHERGLLRQGLSVVDEKEQSQLGVVIGNELFLDFQDKLALVGFVWKQHPPLRCFSAQLVNLL